MSTLIDSYRREMERAGLADGTMHHRTSILRRLERDRGPLLELSTEQLRGWLDRPLSDRARYCNISHLACFYRWAVMEGHALADPTLRLTRPKLRRGLPRPIPTADLALVLEQASGMVRVMVALGAYSGLRCCEVSRLDGCDVQDERGLLLVHGKGGRERVVPLHPIVAELLRGHGVPHRGPVFVEHGRRLPAWRVSHLVRGALHSCGVVASAHQLRHWFATATYEASGHDLRMVQELLGHATRDGLRRADD